MSYVSLMSMYIHVQPPMDWSELPDQHWACPRCIERGTHNTPRSAAASAASAEAEKHRSRVARLTFALSKAKDAERAKLAAQLQAEEEGEVLRVKLAQHRAALGQRTRPTRFPIADEEVCCVLKRRHHTVCTL